MGGVALEILHRRSFELPQAISTAEIVGLAAADVPMIAVAGHRHATDRIAKARLRAQASVLVVAGVSRRVVHSSSPPRRTVQSREPLSVLINPMAPLLNLMRLPAAATSGTPGSGLVNHVSRTSIAPAFPGLYEKLRIGNGAGRKYAAGVLNELTRVTRRSSTPRCRAMRVLGPPTELAQRQPPYRRSHSYSPSGGMTSH